MSWYVAALYIEGVPQPRKKNSLWEEQFVLLQAKDAKEAEKKARKLANRYEAVSVGKAEGKKKPGRIKWVFRKMLLHQVKGDRPEDGSELFYRFLLGSEVKSLFAPLEGEVDV